MTNVSWSHAKGTHSFVTSLTSSHGHARCHTQDSHCLMGCITCGTNYTVAMEAYSHSGRSSNCTYGGFSSSEWECFLSTQRIYYPSFKHPRTKCNALMLNMFCLLCLKQFDYRKMATLMHLTYIFHYSLTHPDSTNKRRKTLCVHDSSSTRYWQVNLLHNTSKNYPGLLILAAMFHIKEQDNE